jgi:proteasome lid subunit RPN8/RPN11
VSVVISPIKERHTNKYLYRDRVGDGGVKLKLKHSDLKAIDAHAMKSYPKECCGLLLGKFGKSEIEVKEAVEAGNILGSPVAFEAEPELVFKVFQKAEKSGSALVGIYHSHPDIAAFVSSKDAEVMKLWPGTAWLILSVGKTRVLERMAYTMKNNEIKEIAVETS